VAFDSNYFPTLWSAFVAADATLREQLENSETNAENANKHLLRSWILCCE
jgi:hypothetical protein